MTISEKIFDMLHRKKMTQKEFSQRTGIRESTISDWKHKKVNPSADKILIICDVLGISPYELLSGSGEKFNKADYMMVHKDSQEYELLETFRDIENDVRNRIIGYAEALKSSKQ